MWSGPVFCINTHKLKEEKVKMKKMKKFLYCVKEFMTVT